MTPPPPPPAKPEAQARVEIDAALGAAGWIVQDRDEMNLSVAEGVAVREFKLRQGYGFADYLLFVKGKAVGVLEAKQVGNTLIGIEPQVTRYASGLPDGLNPAHRAAAVSLSQHRRHHRVLCGVGEDSCHEHPSNAQAERGSQRDPHRRTFRQQALRVCGHLAWPLIDDGRTFPSDRYGNKISLNRILN